MNSAELNEVKSALARLEKLQALVHEDIEKLDRIKGEVLDAIETFDKNLGFTAPELWGMRLKQLREAVEDAFETTEQGNDDTGT